jgi:hypothetical protein
MLVGYIFDYVHNYLYIFLKKLKIILIFKNEEITGARESKPLSANCLYEFANLITFQNFQNEFQDTHRER